MVQFSRLPDELLISIFEQLDALSLLAVSATCRLWHELAKSPSLAYIILCHRCCVVDGTPDDRWPVSRRIDALTSYYARYSSLRWYKSYCFNRNRANLWELFGGVYAQGNQGQTTLEFQALMCATTGEEETQWSVDTTVETRDFGMDPFQDLLVIIKHLSNTAPRREVHLRTLSTGEEHPEATKPVLRVSCRPRVHADSHWIQVANQYIGILFENIARYDDLDQESNDLIIWDWKAGQIIFKRSSNQDSLIDSFCFISQHHILTAIRGLLHPDSRRLYEKSYLEVFDITSPTTPVRRFLLPPMKANSVVWGFSICCDPVPAPSAYRPRPFYTSPDSRICVVTTRFVYEIHGMIMEERNPINFIFFTSSLLDTPFQSSEEVDEPEAVTVIPWSDWAEFTRVTQWKPPSQNFTISVSGTRFVRRIPGNAPNHYHIQICDFNKYALGNQDAIPNPATSVCTTKYIHLGQDNLLRNTAIFKEPISTSLPYLEITTRSSFKLHDVMIDHDNIYLILDAGARREVEVLAF